MENKNILKIYKKLEFVCVSATLSVNEAGKKELSPLVGWKKTNKTMIDETRNALIIKNKTKLSDNNYLFIIDIDNKPNGEGITGLDAFNKICSDNQYEIKTITQQTANKGFHYLFKTSNKDLYESKQILGLKINGIENKIDIPNCIIAEPSKLIKKHYKFLNITDDVNDIQILPEFLETIILKNNEKPINNHVNNEIVNVNTNYPLLNILINHFDDYHTWAKMCWLLKSLKYSFEVFDEYSQKFPKKYNKTDVYNFWTKCKASNSINEGLLYSLAKNENPDEFNKLGLSYNFFKPDIIPVETIEIKKKYLIDEVKKNINGVEVKDYELSSFFNDKFNEFFSNDNIKSFNIKSPYNTGKTQLLKLIIKKYNLNRILFVSYRKTLSSDIYGSFKEFNFKDYRTCQCDKEDRLIIQLDSIQKIKPSDECLLVDEEIELPKYDLIIMDEIESTLHHFTSKLMEDKSKHHFNFLDAVIRNSNKLITLDGDLSFRGFNYIKNFGDSINVINTIKKNVKQFKFIRNKLEYYKDIEDSINNDEKIVIVSQSAAKCEEIELILRNKFTYLQIQTYTGNSDDQDKTNLKNVLDIWRNLDVLIYSPTIEAGVSFDLQHFDKIYGVVSSNCNSQRAFLQMLSRVRQTSNTNILILYQGLEYTAFEEQKLISFDEIKTSLITFNIIKIEDTYINNKIVKRLTPFDVNYCYNKIEELYKHKYYYLGYLEYLLKKKGHEVEFNYDNTMSFEEHEEEKAKYEKFKTENEYKLDSNLVLYETKDISKNKYTYLLDKQKQDRATKYDKLQVKKYVVKSSLGVDKVSEGILKHYSDPYIIKNIEYLIDKKNIKDNNNQQTKETHKKIDIVNDMLSTLGFKLFQNVKVSRKNFEKRCDQLMTTNILFTEYKLSKILFNKSKGKFETNKQCLGFLNSILENYKLCIKSNQVRVKKADLEDENKTKDTVYTLEFLKDYDTINEIIQYKIDKGYILHDTKKIRPAPETDTYSQLILSSEERIKYNDELEEKEQEAEFKEYMKTKKTNNNTNTEDEYNLHFPDPDGLDWFPPTK